MLNLFSGDRFVFYNRERSKIQVGICSECHAPWWTKVGKKHNQGHPCDCSQPRYTNTISNIDLIDEFMRAN